ncbi:uncharacterized protein TNCV_1078201 [Trichonephila clavipes]|nr:uncharacterized protein TNCV_1078201 [Trichonephila clavipes]
MKDEGCGSPVGKVLNHGRHVMSSSPVPLKTRRVGQRCTLNLPRAETSSRWCGVVVWRGWCQLSRMLCIVAVVSNPLGAGKPTPSPHLTFPHNTHTPGPALHTTVAGPIILAECLPNCSPQPNGF